MDPDVAYAQIYDANLPTVERIEALDALTSWLRRGGFPPRGWTHLRRGLNESLRQQHSALIRLRNTERRDARRRERAAESID